MKLEDWARQFDILEIDKELPSESRWPNLGRLLELCDNIPRFSSSDTGWGCFIGWATADKDWVYHHCITCPRSQISRTLFDFHDGFGRDAIASYKGLVPIFNVGDVVESPDFVRALRKAGIDARINSPAMCIARLRTKGLEHSH